MPSKPNILIIGPSGSGKTCSLEGMFTKYAPDIAFIDTERKGLPFLFDRSKLCLDLECADYKSAQDAMTKAKASPAKFIVYDSLSKYFDWLGSYCDTAYKGYDIWKNYGIGVGNCFEFNKSTGKTVVAIMHDEIVYVEQPGGGRVSRIRAATKGNMWEGKIEKEWLIVLVTMVATKDGKTNFSLATITDGVHPAKVPKWLGLPAAIPNDLSPVIDKLVEAILV